MKNLFLSAVLLTATTFAAAKKPNDGFVSLFNGKDLSGWTTTGNWLPQKDGSLLIQPRPGEKGWKRYDDYLTSEEKYKDFILEIEYKYPKGGNSGVYFRIADPKDPVNTGIECQVLDSFGKPDEKMGHHDHGGIIRTVGPTKNMSKPGEWNKMIVTCKGYHLQVNLNGENIIDHQLNTKGEGKLSGVADRPLEGYISLQDHGEPNNLFFRNIRIKEL